MVPIVGLKLEDDEKYSHRGRLSRNGKASLLRCNSNPTFLQSHPIHQRQSFRAEPINFVANSDSLEEGLEKTLIIVVWLSSDVHRMSLASDRTCTPQCHPTSKWPMTCPKDHRVKGRLIRRPVYPFTAFTIASCGRQNKSTRRSIVMCDQCTKSNNGVYERGHGHDSHSVARRSSVSVSGCAWELQTPRYYHTELTARL